MEEHPIAEPTARAWTFTINSDDVPIFGSDVSEEYPTLYNQY